MKETNSILVVHTIIRYKTIVTAAEGLSAILLMFYETELVSYLTLFPSHNAIIVHKTSGP